MDFIRLVHLLERVDAFMVEHPATDEERAPETLIRDLALHVRRLREEVTVLRKTREKTLEEAGRRIQAEIDKFTSVEKAKTDEFAIAHMQANMLRIALAIIFDMRDGEIPPAEKEIATMTVAQAVLRAEISRLRGHLHYTMNRARIALDTQTEDALAEAGIRVTEDRHEAVA